MAPPTHLRGGKYATTYDYNAASMGIKTPHIPSENRIIQALIEAALEGGRSASDAVRFGIETYKEIDIWARDDRGNILSRTSMKTIRVFARAILRSGEMLPPTRVASRAVAAWREMLKARDEIHKEWEKETVAQRAEKRRKKGQEKAAMREELRPFEVVDNSVPIVEPLRDQSGYVEYMETLNSSDPCSCCPETKRRTRDASDPAAHDPDCLWRMTAETANAYEMETRTWDGTRTLNQ